LDATLLILGRTYKWQFPLGLALLAALVAWVVSGSSGFSKSMKAIITISAVVLSVSLLILGARYVAGRSRWWWTLNSDITFTEAVAQSLGRWGFVDHVAAIGQSDLGTYHWLPFAWVGLVDRLSSADAWWISTRAAHVVFIFGSVAVLWSLFKATRSSGSYSTAFSTLIAALIGLFVGANFSGMVGTFWVILVLWYWNEVVRKSHGVAEALVLALLSFGLWLTKPQYAVPLVAGLLLVDVSRAVRQVDQHSSVYSRVAGLGGAGIVVFILQRLLAGSNVAASGVIKLDLVSLGSFGELGNARNLFALPLAAISILSTTLLLGVFLFLMRKDTSTKELRVLSAVVSILSLVAIFVTDAMFHFLGGYLIGLLWTLTGLLAGLALPNVWKLLHSQKRLMVSLCIAAPLSFFFVKYWPKFFSPNPTGSVVDMTLRTLAGAEWIPVAAISVLITVLLRMRMLQRGSTQLNFPTVVAVSLVVLSLNPVNIASASSRVLRSNTTVDSNLPTGVVTLDNDVTQLNSTVASTVPEDALFASNIFCAYDVESLCGSEGWWTAYVQTLQEVHVPKRCYNLLIYSNDWSLPGVLERRFLIQGPQMFTGCGPVPEWLSERVKWSEEFGRRATRSSFDALCANEVSWFIADRQLTDLQTWEPFGAIVLEQDRLVLIRLNTESCSSIQDE
jgi:hypothetical protein